MLTLFSIPKSFKGEAGDRQRRAIESWSAFASRIVLIGNNAGIAEVANAFNVGHVTVAVNANATPLLDAAFAQIDDMAPAGVRCFVNSDIVLTKDLLAAVDAVRAFPRFLLVGQSRDLSLTDAEMKDAERLRLRALREGRMRGAAAIDWFVFPSGLFDPLPPFVVGRAGFDNWMIWKARQLGPVIDATDAVVAIHQPHDYTHLSGGKDQAYYGEEAKRNVALGGGKAHTYTLHDASHKMRSDFSIHRNLGSILRARETMRKIGWKLGLR